MLRGRLHLMIADIAMRGGSVARAFTYAQQALGEFDSAQFGVAPWRASALMFTAILYSQLGANGEAFGALAEAVGIIAPLGMPSRMALAMNIFADIETNLHHDTSALWWRRVAEETYSRLNMAPAYQATRAVRLGMQARRGEVADVRRELATLSGGDPLHAAGPLLLAAELAVREGRLDEARAALDQANRTPLSLRDQIRIAVIEAQQHARSGDAESAQHVLRAAAMRVDALAQHAGYAALRYVIARQALALRQTAFELVLDSPASPATINAVEAIWPWLVQSENTRTGSSAQSMGLSAAEPFDRAVAAELLSQPGRPPLPSDVSAQRALLSLLAQPASADTAQSAASTPPLAAFQRQLDADTAVIAYVDGSTRGALLWVTREDARLVAAAPPDQVRASALALREQVRSAAAPIAELRATAQQLSAQLLGAAPAAHAPARLFVIAADPLDGIAWSVLPWPGGSEALVESTAVSLVHLATETEHAGHAAARMPDQLHVVVAAQAHAGDTPLRSLSVASVEAAQIRQALGEDPLRVDENAHASARAVLDMLGEPAAWVHVAAHGTARPLRIGYAGIWLEPPAPDATPAFLSWLDVLDNGVRADLIVLDACQLGDSGSAVSGNLSFADAVARAGARRVIAALWPVSDAASALWVPEFYRALVGDPHHDAAQALRAAQLRLRATRAFTHPFFWAGMQSIERLPLAPGPSAAHVKPGG